MYDNLQNFILLDNQSRQSESVLFIVILLVEEIVTKKNMGFYF